MAGTTFVVADLHGRRDLLEAALEAIEGYGAPDDRDRTVVFLGDYVDRGPGSAQILDRLTAGPPTGWRWICLKGNHEVMMALALRNPERLDGWLENGGGATVASYGDHRERIAGHLAWIDRLPPIHTDAHRVYVHAGVEPTMPLHAQAEMTLLWKRYPAGVKGGHGARHVVHGHDPDAGGPIFHEGRLALDTRAWETGRLVIGVFDDARAGPPVDLIEIRRAPG